MAASRSPRVFAKQTRMCSNTRAISRVEDDIELFFWFFEAREDPDKKPLVAQLNGGPGGGSIDLIGATGPCVFQYAQDEDPFFQKLYEHDEFSKFKGRDTGIFTISYGGIIVPALAKYILEQNASKNGVPINL
ncbi:Uu.00g013060.m01.CDS01 [Anthostomella pinea]|uniref:Uu.00g013060.m01.CDS01 n=1 Tax=Anthostomella pinea TaxID=933095 RepID=A0AAI8YMY7_9PEZI|nr:Uu.00g013060.m01.CDS01 [Anthostomella pinea]